MTKVLSNVFLLLVFACSFRLAAGDGKPGNVTTVNKVNKCVAIALVQLPGSEIPFQHFFELNCIDGSCSTNGYVGSGILLHFAVRCALAGKAASSPDLAGAGGASSCKEDLN